MFCAVAACMCGMLFASSAGGAGSLSALQKAMDSSADWTMTRQLPGSSRTLESRGTVDCRAGKGIVWSVKEPFESSVEMTPTAMIFTDEDGRREKSLDDLPHYDKIRKATDAFVAGNTNAFDGVFSVTEQRTADGGWTVTLAPEVSAMKRLFTSVELSGAALPTNAVMKTEGCGSSVIRFKERPRVR